MRSICDQNITHYSWSTKCSDNERFVMIREWSKWCKFRGVGKKHRPVIAELSIFTLNFSLIALALFFFKLTSAILKVDVSTYRETWKHRSRQLKIFKIRFPITPLIRNWCNSNLHGNSRIPNFLPKPVSAMRRESQNQSQLIHTFLCKIHP